MEKHRLKNIANRPIPVDGTDLKPVSGEIVEAKITKKLKYMIKNKFFEDLGVVEEAPVNRDVFEEPEEEPYEEAREEEAKLIEDYVPKPQPRKKKGKKKSKKKEVKTSEEW